MLPYSEEIVAQLIAELRIRDSRDAQGHALAKKKGGSHPSLARRISGDDPKTV